MNPVFEKLPDYPIKEIKTKILEIQEELFQFGITGVHEAGLTNKEFKLMDRLVKQKKLKTHNLKFGVLLT